MQITQVVEPFHRPGWRFETSPCTIKHRLRPVTKQSPIRFVSACYAAHDRVWMMCSWPLWLFFLDRWLGGCLYGCTGMPTHSLYNWLAHVLDEQDSHACSEINHNSHTVYSSNPQFTDIIGGMTCTASPVVAFLLLKHLFLLKTTFLIFPKIMFT